MPSRSATAKHEPGSGAAIEAVDLTRRFGERSVVDRLTLRIEAGEAFGLLGANGAGKTTFIRLVTGYLVPTAGSITVDGLSPVTQARAVNARIGFVAETSHLYPELRVRQFLRFVGGARGLYGEALERAVRRVSARFGVDDVSSRPIGNLSKGYQQRVSLAQAFLHDPPLLIVDEPTSGLDPLQQAEVRGMLRKVRGERTVLLCTHDLSEARELTRRVAVMSEGRLMALGPTSEILDGSNPLELFRTQREETS
jgi:ABC-2 type transport system ATP-binding protein